jgi:hypothetical protein
MSNGTWEVCLNSDRKNERCRNPIALIKHPNGKNTIVAAVPAE